MVYMTKKKKKVFEILMEDCVVQLFIVQAQNNKIYFRSLVYGLYLYSANKQIFDLAPLKTLILQINN